MSSTEPERSGSRDLAVELDWPVDPLAPASPPPAEPEVVREVVPLVDMTTVTQRIDLLRNDMQAPPATMDELLVALQRFTAEVLDVLGEMAAAMDRLSLTPAPPSADETAQAVSGLIDDRMNSLRTALMSMLTAREPQDQRNRRRDDALATRVQEEVAALGRELTEAIAAARTQSDVFADRVAAELQALRRRIPVQARSAPAAAVDAAVIDDLVARVADEVEIRFAAALGPRDKRDSGGGRRSTGRG